ncbi:peptidase inhibitor I9 [Tupanvirus deep ocean]|uniref:Peptidase inhibitor I9 n=2 Tax=Tupanvirus TaxID=2094720 RepID=A0AC62A9A9_9VIRU|nr:peptidase inhibitor I9 [Tupanvirus deep ocean]QKU34257.1 peptidase inhibitor I9 [Tupanvirus deep ocean]
MKSKCRCDNTAEIRLAGEKVIAQLNDLITILYPSGNNFNITNNNNGSITIVRSIDGKSFTLNFIDEDLDEIINGCRSWLNKLQIKFITQFLDPNQVVPTSSEVKKWVVKFKPGFNAGNYVFPKDITILDKYSCVFSGMCCKSTEKTLVDFNKLTNSIESYYLDQEVHIQVLKDKKILTKNEVVAMAQSVGPFINRISANHSSQKSGDGTGSLSSATSINVFVLDTGIAPHPDLNIVGGRNFTSTNTNAWQDGHGHGTHVAGIIGAMDNGIGIVGVAPGVRLWAVKVLSNNGSGSTSGIISALNWILSSRGTLWHGYGIINMSLGGPAFAPLDSAIQTVANNGLVPCVAAGNESTNAINVSPARVPAAITVGATGPNPTYTTIAPYSNYGSILDILAPGTNIYSTFLNGSYAVMSGTSMATPVVSGTVALIASTRSLGTPTTLTYTQNVRYNLVTLSSAPLTNTNYDGTVTTNPRIILSSVAAAAGTTDISVRAGMF